MIDRGHLVLKGKKAFRVMEVETKENVVKALCSPRQIRKTDDDLTYAGWPEGGEKKPVWVEVSKLQTIPESIT